MEPHEKEVMGELRLRGIDDLREVRLARVENEGALSVLHQEWAEPLRKGDLGGEAGKAMRQALGDDWAEVEKRSHDERYRGD